MLFTTFKHSKEKEFSQLISNKRIKIAIFKTNFSEMYVSSDKWLYN